MKTPRLARKLLVANLGLLACGCAVPRQVEPFAPLPMQVAIDIANENNGRITGTLKASGVVDGYFRSSKGRRHRFHLDATLFYLEPHYLRFDLKKFNTRQILFGSNDEDYWFYTKDDDAFRCGRHGTLEDFPSGIPVHPGQIGHALGLAPIDADVAGDERCKLAQRVVDEYQQLLCVSIDESGRLVVGKEYWLDRRPPQLVRRVVFRDSEGIVEMESRLEEYEAVGPGGPQLPMVMIADWPQTDTHMRFRIGKWTAVDQVTGASVQFKTPLGCSSP